MKRMIAGCFVALMGMTSLLQAMPQEVIIVRHAEKPQEDTVNVAQQRYRFLQKLSPEGWSRAQQLADILKSRYTDGSKVVLFAERATLTTSSRAEETLIPTAYTFRLPVITYYGRNNIDEFVELLKDEKLNGKVVVISFEKEGLNELARRVYGMGSQNVDQVGDFGSQDVYNRVAIINFDRSGARFQATTYEDLKSNPSGSSFGTSDSNYSGSSNSDSTRGSNYSGSSTYDSPKGSNYDSTSPTDSSNYNPTTTPNSSTNSSNY